MSKKKCILISVIATFLITVLGIFCLLTYFTPMAGYMAMRSLITNAYMEDMDTKTLDDAAFSGMMSALDDPYSMYLSEEEFEILMEDLTSTYQGIGIEIYIDPKDNMVTVAGVFEKTPAFEAGIRQGDKIIQINDLVVNGDTYADMLTLLKSDQSVSTFDITIKRGEQQLTVTAGRREIQIETVTYKKYGDIAYIAISEFSEPTAEDFKKAMEQADLENSAGLIIDLRNNPGGLLPTVVDIADLLLPECDIVYTQNKKGEREYFKSDAKQTDVPMVILMNGNTASASEVLIGALRDNKGTPTVGTKSYGKGSVQSLVTLPGKPGAARLTTSHYYSPAGTCIHEIGFVPDYEVELPGDAAQVAISALTEEQDIQLAKAIEILQK